MYVNNKIKKEKLIGRLKIKHGNSEEIEIEVYSSIGGEQNEMLVNEYLCMMQNYLK